MLHKYEGLALHFSRDRRRMLIARAGVHSRQAVLTNRGSDGVKTESQLKQEKKKRPLDIEKFSENANGPVSFNFDWKTCPLRSATFYR
jgi:hypothetical protein